MNARKSLCITAATTLLSSMILTGCGIDKPESMLVSAKAYMAKNDNKAAVIQLKNALQSRVYCKIMNKKIAQKQ